ncbi:MAG: tetratricopeptide repeat protein [Gemmataceae bacterium]
MDCRKWLWTVLASGIAGCAHEAATNLVNSSPQGVAEAKPEKELPKRAPKAHTCVVLANLKEKEAEATKAPHDQQSLRDQARQLYQQALEIEPDNLEALRGLAKMYCLIGDRNRAMATYQRALKSHPTEGGLWYDLGMYQSQCKEWDPAIQNLRQAVACEPENRFFANTLGFCLARAGRYDESLACFQQMVGPAKAHYNLARMLVHMNQTDLGKEHLRQAIEADPQMEEPRQMLAQLNGSASNLAIPPPDALSAPPGASGQASRPGLTLSVEGVSDQ